MTLSKFSVKFTPSLRRCIEGAHRACTLSRVGGVSYLHCGLVYRFHSTYDILIDADECYGRIVDSLSDLPGPMPSASSAAAGKKFVEQFLMGEIKRE
jgi:hypothetical protein